MEYNGYTISEDLTGYAPKSDLFSFFLDDGETFVESGFSIDDCKHKIDYSLKNKIMNPIKDNRIVQDITFATRLNSFLKDIQVNDPMSEEELEYLQRVAKSLLLHQANTSTEKSEKEYLHRCHPEGI